MSSVNTNIYESNSFNHGTGPVLSILSVDQARQVVEYSGDQELRRRIEELAAKSTEGTLTAAEKSDYEGYVYANKFVAILQAQARKRLAGQSQK